VVDNVANRIEGPGRQQLKGAGHSELLSKLHDVAQSALLTPARCSNVLQAQSLNRIAFDFF
jgi:hypothetical protein